MKDDVLDVLMYLFDHYEDDDLQMSVEHDVLRGRLMDAGFPAQEIDKAFAWVDKLAGSEGQQEFIQQPSPSAMRSYTSAEQEKMNTRCRSFLLFLEQAEVINALQRENIIDGVMALESERINLEQLKWIIMMILENQADDDDEMTWKQDLMLGETEGMVH